MIRRNFIQSIFGFLIAPVTNLTDKLYKKTRKYYAKLESVELFSNFELEQIFCGCPIDRHYEYCSGFNCPTPKEKHVIIVNFADEDGNKMRLTAEVTNKKWEKIT